MRDGNQTSGGRGTGATGARIKEELPRDVPGGNDRPYVAAGVGILIFPPGGGRASECEQAQAAHTHHRLVRRPRDGAGRARAQGTVHQRPRLCGYALMRILAWTRNCAVWEQARISEMPENADSFF
eukprot:COSAG02_NODE_7_length_64539_cov_120.393482_52_plen_126_part_00